MEVTKEIMYGNSNSLKLFQASENDFEVTHFQVRKVKKNVFNMLSNLFRKLSMLYIRISSSDVFDKVLYKSRLTFHRDTHEVLSRSLSHWSELAPSQNVLYMIYMISVKRACKLLENIIKSRTRINTSDYQSVHL